MDSFTGVSPISPVVYFRYKLVRPTSTHLIERTLTRQLWPILLAQVHGCTFDTVSSLTRELAEIGTSVVKEATHSTPFA